MIGEGEAAGIEHGGSGLVPGAVLVVAHQGEAPGGKLHSYLMAAPGVESHTHQGLLARFQQAVGQPCFFNAAAFPLNYKSLGFAAVLPQE